MLTNVSSDGTLGTVITQIGNVHHIDGGSIELVGNVVLVDPLSTINASSQFGVSGSVNIRAPVQNLSGTIAPLPENLLQVTTIMTARCAAQKGGQLSSFVQGGRDILPLEPEDFLASPAFLENPDRVEKNRTNLPTLRLGFVEQFTVALMSDNIGRESSSHSDCTSS
ncbi:MAG: hypothetical protein NPIRA02_06960 [Nitrospirales bacterium]|nr:MAG: hypothetical protein NPIRA02_06960 [Nitrospirales bacterium]